MNVTVFGATGAIGSLTVAELLDRGHSITAYARHPGKVPASWGDRVRVVVGEMSDKDAIDAAIAGADAVVSALGPVLTRDERGHPLTEGTRHLLDAMQRHGVRRYVCHATPPSGTHRSGRPGRRGSSVSCPRRSAAAPTRRSEA